MAAKKKESGPAKLMRVRQMPGSRERLKQQNQKKIILSARSLFAALGYEAATLRRIAADAGVGLATLFTYIDDKRDLIYLVFNEEVEKLTDAALAAPRTEQSFYNKILTITELHYRTFGRAPTLSRILLSEILIHTPGHHLQRHLELRARLIDGLSDLVRDAQRSGEIDADETAEVIAQSIFFLFSAALRWWLASTKPRWREGQLHFERVFRVQATGFIKREASRKPRRQKRA